MTRVRPDVHFVRGRADLLNHQPAQAVQEFQAVLNLRGAYIGDPLMGLAQLYLARSYAQQNDAAKARAAYQDFLALWKDADPDIPSRSPGQPQLWPSRTAPMLPSSRLKLRPLRAVKPRPGV